MSLLPSPLSDLPGLADDGQDGAQRVNLAPPHARNHDVSTSGCLEAINRRRALRGVDGGWGTLVISRRASVGWAGQRAWSVVRLQSARQGRPRSLRRAVEPASARTGARNLQVQTGIGLGRRQLQGSPACAARSSVRTPMFPDPLVTISSPTCRDRSPAST
jgi:hypothetical protein